MASCKIRKYDILKEVRKELTSTQVMLFAGKWKYRITSSPQGCIKGLICSLSASKSCMGIFWFGKLLWKPGAEYGLEFLKKIIAAFISPSTLPSYSFSRGKCAP